MNGTSNTSTTKTMRVPATRVQPGDMADHKSGTLDPRPVTRVEGRSIWISIGTLNEVGPLPRSNYTYTRVVSA